MEQVKEISQDKEVRGRSDGGRKVHRVLPRSDPVHSPPQPRSLRRSIAGPGFRGSGGRSGSDPGAGGSFALFLENCAPAVNSLNLGITNPLLLGSANLQLAQIKAQLALQQLNSVASTTVSNTALASLNQALVKINMSMFNARGAFGQNQGPPNQFGQSQGPPNQFGQSQGPPNQFGQSQGPPNQFGQSQGPPNQFGQNQGPPNQFQNQGPPNQFAMSTPGSYMGGGGGGGAGRGMGMGTQGASQGNYGGMNMGMMNQSGNNVGLGQWSSYQSPSSGGYRPGYGSTATSSSQSGDQRSAVQLFHDTMKASNILANFGLSNEDLEELSRYPDEKLTPENMPYILREIRMRKMNKQQSSSSYDQPYKLQDKDYRREVQSSVVDYGHGQQYDYRDRPMENQSMHYSRETLREGTWNEDFKRPPQNYPMEPSRDESTHGIKRTVLVVKKGLPKPKLMNDYYGVPALRFPHVCSLCNVECRQMRDWDRHNKTSVHNDSCRLLLKEYPDWDPDAVPPTKDDLAKKEKEAVAAEQATTPFSSARMSPKHLSPRRISPHRTSPRRLSPRKSSPRRLSPRKISPRRMSPHRSRSSPRRTSPHRSRSSPRRTSPYRSRSSPHRSRPRRLSPHKSRPSPKHSSPQRSSPRTSNPKRKIQKDLPAKNSNQKPPVSQLTNQKPPNKKIMKRPAVTGKPFAEAKSNTGPAAAAASTVVVEKPAAQQEANAQQMNEMRKSGRVVHITDLPHDGYTEEDISKLTQPFGKVTGIKLLRSKNEAFLEMAYKEAAVAVVEFYSITPVEINHRQVSMMLLGQKKEIPKLDQREQLQNQAAAFVQEEKNIASSSAVPQTTSEATTPPADAKMSEDESPTVQKTQSEDVSLNDKGRVIRINNLPAKGYTEEDLKRLAKPFGQVLNIVITFSKNQAYLEMACMKAATKMVEFYSLSTIKLKGNAISMEILHQYVDLSDMEVIFKDMIEESGFKPDDGCTIYDHLVHISNLPEDGYTEVDILCVAFRFGRVKDSMFLKPHNKVLLHLENGNAAASMCSFFREIPHDFHGKTLEFSLSPHAAIQPENEGKSERPTEESCDASKEPDPMETEPTKNAESEEVEMTDETLSAQTKAESTEPSVMVTCAPETETIAATVPGEAAHDLVPTTATEPPAAVKPTVAATSSASTPLTTKSPAPLAAGTPADVATAVSSSTNSTPAGKAVAASRNAPSKPAVVAANAAAKPAALSVKPAAPATSSIAKLADPVEDELTKPTPVTCGVGSPAMLTKPLTASSAAKPSQTATSAATKPPQDTDSAVSKAAAAGANTALKPAATPAPVPTKPGQMPAQAVVKPSPVPGNAAVTPTATAAPKVPPAAGAGVVSKPAPAPSKAAGSPTAASAPLSTTAPCPPAVEKASPIPTATASTDTPTPDGATAPTPTLTPSAPPKTTNPTPTNASNTPTSNTTSTSNTTTRPPKSMVVKPSSKESSVAKSNEKKSAAPRKEHAAKESGKASTPARGRSTSRESSSREGSGRSGLSYQKEREFRSDRRHVPQHQRDRDYRSYLRSKISSERSSKDRKASSKSPKREVEKDIFPFNLDEFVTVDEVGEEEDSCGDQIPGSESETNTQTSESAELETTGTEATEEVRDPEPVAAADPFKAAETTEVTPKLEAQPEAQSESQPEAKAAKEDGPVETVQEKPAEAPAAEPSKAPITDTKQEATAASAAGTTAAQREAAPPVAGSGEPARSAVGHPPINLTPATSGGDTTRSAGVEQRADAKLKREAPPELEPTVKRIKLAGTTLAELKMPPYKPNSPIGVEFIVPKTGYFCQICSLFYTNEDTAKVTHCGTVLHYKNMEKYVTQRQEDLRRQQERMAKQDK
ncbi:zinc finger protein 638 [Pristis pectinata]|uniref:zinc finger protein 638 n=1 Tax=Pristis pectinata TaxID=685728 RepID=UPI00223E8755|nr:zinc finger protein 638 [Pristis pectinata]